MCHARHKDISVSGLAGFLNRGQYLPVLHEELPSGPSLVAVLLTKPVPVKVSWCRWCVYFTYILTDQIVATGSHQVNIAID